MNKNVLNKKQPAGPAVHSITDAHEAHTDEMRRRIIKYSVSMGVRMVCLVMVFFTQGWLQWVFIAGAVFLPYFAVVIANAGGDTAQMERSTALLDQAPRPELDAEARPAAAEPDAQVLQGEIVTEEEGPKNA